MKILEVIMQTHLVINKKPNHYPNILMNVSRRECLTLSNIIKKSKEMKNYFDNWIFELDQKLFYL